MQVIKFNWSRDLTLLAVTVFFLSLGFEGIYMSIYNNFIVNDIGINPGELGVIEAIRETPGFLSAFIAALTMHISSPFLGGLTLLTMAFGIGAFSQTYTVNSLVFWAVFWSIGFHCWAPLQPAMVLSLSKGESKGKRLGQIWRTGDIAALTGMGLIAIVGKEGMLRPMFLAAGGAIAVGAVIVLFISKNATESKMPRLIMKKKYRFYYILTFLDGCRKQLFGTFAIFVLVRVFETNVRVVARLMIVNRVMRIIFVPIIGRIVDRIGERRSLSISNTGLILVFLGYAIVRDQRILYFFYCFESFVYMFIIAQTTYLNKIAPPGDIRPTLSMGTTMNHVASVIVPLIGGFLWSTLDRYDVIFYGGAIIALISLIVAQFLRVKEAEQS